MHNEKLVKKLEENEAKFKTPEIIAKYIPHKKIKKTEIINDILKQKRIKKFQEKVNKSSKYFVVSEKFDEEQDKKIAENRKRRLKKYGYA